MVGYRGAMLARRLRKIVLLIDIQSYEKAKAVARGVEGLLEDLLEDVYRDGFESGKKEGSKGNVV